MIIVMVHNAYKELGGEDLFFERESHALEESGHTVHRYLEDNSAITPATRILAGFSAIVPRAQTVRVEYLDERGEARSVDATGWYARILQHEIDHLLGTLYIDRMQSRTFTSLDNWNRYWKGKAVSGA